MLIIVESPAKARTIRSILGKKYQVEASIGHVRALSDDKKNKEGKKLLVNGIDIENNFAPLYVVADGKKEVVSKLKKIAKNSDQILFATDSDREGEAISWHLSELLGIRDKSSIRRLEFHEITDEAIQEAIAHPRTLNLDLVEAQKARQVLDKLVGYRLSPVLWTTLSDYKLSAGRVQSPALVLVYKREQEIEVFVSEEYWEGYGDFSATQQPLQTYKYSPEDEVQKLPFTLKKLPQKFAVIDAQSVEGIESDLQKDQKFVVTGVLQKKATSRPKPPFTTSTLQQAASSRLGMSPRVTMQAAQKLYEGVDIGGKPVALITYMRTDSTHLSKEALAKIREHLSRFSAENLHSETRVYSSKSKNAQEAHEAIRPTRPHITPDSLKGKLEPRLWKLYNLIWSRAMATQCKDEVRELTTYTLSNQLGYAFGYTRSQQVVTGYKEFEGIAKSSEKEPKVTLTEGGQYYLDVLSLLQKFTQPPGRYSPASLIKELESQGIGRPSTYATIISTLYDRGYVEDDQKVLKPTTLGKTVAKLLLENFSEITSAVMTANMEDNLDKISRGEASYGGVLHDFWDKFDKEVQEKSTLLREKKDIYKTVSTEKIPDPNGKGMLVLKLGRFGEYWQNEEDPAIMYPKFFREIEEILKKNRSLYDEKLQGLVSPVSQEPLIVRVSKTSLNPYIATEKYTVGSQEKALSIDKLNEMGWTQESINTLYSAAEKQTGSKKRFKRATKYKKRKK